MTLPLSSNAFLVLITHSIVPGNDLKFARFFPRTGNPVLVELQRIETEKAGANADDEVTLCDHALLGNIGIGSMSFNKLKKVIIFYF